MEAVTQRLAELLELLAARDEVQRALLALPMAPAALEQAATLFEARDFAPGEVLVEESAEDVELVLVIVEGEADALSRPQTAEGRAGEPQRVGRLEPLDVVGEIGLVMRTRRSATVRARTPIRALAIRREPLAELMGVHAALAAALVRWCAQNAAAKMVRARWMHEEALPMGLAVKAGEEHQAAAMPAPDYALADADRHYVPSGPKTTEKVRARLRELRCFAWEIDEITPAIAALFRLVTVPSRRAILSEGELGDTLLVMSRGIANIRKRDGELVHGWVAGHHQPVHTLVGEMAFLNPGARSGTVLAATDCELLELSAGALPALVRAAPRLAQLLHLGILRAVCPKLAETSAYRATVEAVAQGDWEQWFVEDDYYTRKLKALDL
ncbi:MAG: cyclic nucleotide-binding domain-containing protein [Pseudomonadota bacterium]